MVTDQSQQVPQDINTKRTKCEIYTRVMGYFRPVSQFNIGKKSEHKERTHFQENSSLDRCTKSE